MIAALPRVVGAAVLVANRGTWPATLSTGREAPAANAGKQAHAGR